MILLLGGPPRVGKSVIAGRIRQKCAVSVVSTDSLGAVLENVLSPAEAPDLFVFDRFNKMPLAARTALIRKDPAELIDYVRRESHVIWKAVEVLIRKENEEGRDLFLEGTAVLPELVSRLKNVSHRAVFIGNQGVNHKANIRRFARENEHDWMQNMSDRYISTFALFVNRMSVYIEQEAARYGFEYLEMDKKQFGNVPGEVMNLLGWNAGEQGVHPGSR